MRCQVTRAATRGRLTWHKHIFAKRKQLGITLTKTYWLLGCKSKLFTSNNLFICKTILVPIWAYRIQLLCTASSSNIGILERLQSKDLHMIMPNTAIRRDLQAPIVKEEILYSARPSAQSNYLVGNLMAQLDNNRRLRRRMPNELPIRFRV
jgi:hypothetical protein